MRVAQALNAHDDEELTQISKGALRRLRDSTDAALAQRDEAQALYAEHKAQWDLGMANAAGYVRGVEQQRDELAAALRDIEDQLDTDDVAAWDRADTALRYAKLALARTPAQAVARWQAMAAVVEAARQWFACESRSLPEKMAANGLFDALAALDRIKEM